MKKTPENIIKMQVKDYLTLMGWFHFPIRQGLGCYPGLPDRIAIKNGIVLFIECKSPKGKLNDSQIIFQNNIQRNNCIYVPVNDIEFFMKFLKLLDKK